MTENYSVETVLSIPELKGPRISPGKFRIAFLSTQTGRPEVWVTDKSTNDVWQVTERDLSSFVGTYDYTWVDDEHLLLQVREKPVDSLQIVTVPEGNQLRSLPRDVCKRTTFRKSITADSRYLISGFGVLGERNSLSRFNLVTGNRKTLGEYWIAHITIDPTDEWIAFTGGEPDASTQLYMCRCRLDGSEFAIVAEDEDLSVYRTRIAWHPDGGKFVFQEVEDDRLAVHTPSDGTTEWIATLEDGDILRGFLDSEHVLVSRCDGRLEGLPLSEEQDTISVAPADEDRSWGPEKQITAVGNGGAAVITEATPDQPPRLLWVTPEESPRILHTTEYGPVKPPDRSPEEHEYESSDGTMAGVDVYHAETDPAPAIGVVYSPANTTPHFPLAGERGLDYCLRQGYTVALAATPSERLTDAVKDDQTAFGEWLCDREWVDDNRIALFGHSAGGHDVANLLLSREGTPWQAGLMYNGIPDLFASQEHEPNNPKITRHLGNPEENRDAWIAQSPIEHIDAGLDAPLRIHHGTDETRVPIEHIRVFRDQLEEAGHIEGDDFEYHELPGEDHASHVVEENARNLLMFVDFLDRRL